MIRVTNLNKTFKTGGGDVVEAMQQIDFDIEKGCFYTLLGPSGCGKSTTLRCVAGLETPDSGEIMVGNRTVFSEENHIAVPPHKRNIGMVFQSYAIWPHMTVAENVAFPLKLMGRHFSSKKINEKVRKALSSVRLDGFENRPAPQLSGGQQQRLALARALVREPDIMLLDEPLSNLDAKLREAMRIELKELLQRLNITTLFVTHDQVEALAMSTKIAVMKEGRIIQEASPEEIYTKPSCRFVADFIGSSNFLEGTVEKKLDGGLVIIKTEHCLWQALLNVKAEVGDKVMVCIRPENLTIETNKPSTEHNLVSGQVEFSTFIGEYKDIVVCVGGDLIRAKLPIHSRIGRGDTVHLHAPPEACIAVGF